MKRPSSAPNASSSSSAAPRSAGSGGKSAARSSRRCLRPGEGVGDPKGCWTRCARRALPSSRDRAGECAMPPGLIDTRAAPAISGVGVIRRLLRRQSSRRAVSGRAPTDDARDATGAVRRRRRWRSRERLATRGWSRWSRWGSSNAPPPTFPSVQGVAQRREIVVWSRIIADSATPLMASMGRERNDLLRLKSASHMVASRPGTCSATTLHARPCFLKLSKNVWHSSSPQRGPRADAAACAARALASSATFVEGETGKWVRHGRYRDEDSKRDPERDTTSATSPRGVARAPRWPPRGSRRERTSPPPSLARFTGGSSLSSSSKYRAGLFAVRARATLGTFHGPSPPTPVSDRDSSDLLLPSRDEGIFARDPRARTDRSTPTRPLRGREADSDRVYTSPRRRFRYGGRRATADVRGAREIGPLALPETKTQRVRVRRDRPLSRECSVKSEPGRRALETLREVSRDVRLSESSKTIQALMCARGARACAPRSPQRRRVVPHRSGSRQLGCCPTCGGVVAAEFIIRNFRCGSREDLTRERLVETVEAVASNARFLGALRALPMVSSGWRERSSANSVVHAACVITTTSARRSTTASPPRFYLIRPRRPRCTLER